MRRDSTKTLPPPEHQPNWYEIASRWIDLIRPVWHEQINGQSIGQGYTNIAPQLSILSQGAPFNTVDFVIMLFFETGIVRLLFSSLFFALV